MEMTAREKKAWNEWQETCKRIRLNHEPLQNESEEKKRKRIERLLKPENFYESCKYYFPDHAKAPFGWFHLEAINDILVKEERNNIWEWSRECAKSVLADIFIPFHLLVTGKLDGMILASSTEWKAKKLLKDLQAQLENNKRIKHDFGDFGITGSWLSGYFCTKDGIGFWSFGLGQDPAGTREGHRRPNYGVIDDADSKKKSKNQEIIEDIVSWVKGEFMGCLATKKRYFILANNRVSKNGLTAHMVGDIEEGDPKNKGFKHIKVYWTEDPETHERLLIDEGGLPAWKENYTLQEAQDKIDDMGYREAMRQLYHMQIIQGKSFNDENMPWVECLPLHKYDALVNYCDPAFGESGKGCYRCVSLIGKTGQHYDIIWVWLEQTGSFAAVQRKLSEQVRENRLIVHSDKSAGFRVKVSCQDWVESNPLQKPHLKRIYKEENLNHETAYFPKFDMDQKPDKIDRIESLEPLAENMHIRFNSAMRKNKHMQTLRDQFKSFPNGFIDGPDCIEGGISKLIKKVKKSSNKPRAGKYKRATHRMA